MSIYIPDVALPKGSRRAISVVICSNGDVYYDGLTKLGNKAIELPAHGRLIDADALKENWFLTNDTGTPVVEVCEIDDDPTIIPPRIEVEDRYAATRC